MINAIAASGGTNVADIVVLVLLGLGLLAGIISGFARLLKGWLGTLIAIVAAVVCCVFLSGMLADKVFAGLGATLEDKIVGFASGLDYSAKVDGKAILMLTGEDWTPLTEIYGSGIKGKAVQILQPLMIFCFGKSLDGTATLAAAASSFVMQILAGVILFIVAIIVVILIFNLLSNLFYKLVAKQKGLRIIDRVFGMIFSGLLAVVIVFAVLLILDKVGASAAGITDMIESSTVAKWFYENNPFIILLSK